MFPKLFRKNRIALAKHETNGRTLIPFRILNWSLSNKLFFSMLLIFSLSALFALTLAGNYIRRSAKNMTLQNLQVISDNKIRLLKMWLDECRQSCAEIAESSVVNQYLCETRSKKTTELLNAIESHFKQFLKYHDVYRQILVLDENHNPLIAIGKDTGKSKNDLSQSVDLVLFLESLSGPTVSDPFLHPITGDPTGVVGAKILTPDGDFLAYLILEIDYYHLDTMLHQFDLGDTGETYLVNKGRLLITQSRFENKNQILRLQISTEGVQAAYKSPYIKGKFKNYRGAQVFGVYRNIPEMDWVLVAEVDINEAQSLVTKMSKAILVPVIVVFLIALLIIKLIVRKLLSSLQEIKTQFEEIGAGDLRGEIDVKSYDEIGQLASHLNDMKSSLREKLLKLQELMRVFNRSISQIGVSLDEHDQTAAQQAISIKQTADSLDDLNSSAGNVLNNSRVVQERVEDTMQAILNLSNKAVEIKEISSSIDEVSVKINLLSLNASIEAARAGEHGRGFGVVAGEIRKLAENTYELTENISGMIADIQKLIQSTMFSAEVMVSEARQIGISVEQQTAGTAQIATSIEIMKEGTLQSAKGASEIAESINELREMAHQIHSLFQHFLINDNSRTEETDSESGMLVQETENGNGYNNVTTQIFEN